MKELAVTDKHAKRDHTLLEQAPEALRLKNRDEVIASAGLGAG